MKMPTLNDPLLGKTISRRHALQLGLSISGAAGLSVGAAGGALAQWAEGAAPDRVPIGQLMKPDGLREFSKGQPDAPVTIIEYASMTCGHCAQFHNETLPQITERYIEPGKARLIFREFPLDLGAAWAAMLSHCASDDEQALEIADALFKRQRVWATGTSREEVKAGMLEVLSPTGLTREALDECVGDQGLLRQIAERAQRAGQVFGVRSTPTFFINGVKLEGAASFAEFASIIDPML